MTILRLYARLLRCYPRAFYDRFGEEMLDVFTQAWSARHSGAVAALALCLHEFGGLLLSIGHQHWKKPGGLMPRFLFNWRRAPFVLLGVSLTLAVIFSLNYWGYLVAPSSTFHQMATVDSIVLAEFDTEYRPTLIPLNNLPYLVTDAFPPSQILPLIKPGIGIAPALDDRLADRITAALLAEKPNLGYPRVKNPAEPALFVDGCAQCFQMGIQPQPDGSLLQLMPEFTADGQPTSENLVSRVTANDWWYYGYLTPAGYIVEGKGADGTPLVFVALTSGAVGNDRYLYYEYVFDASGDRLVVRDHLHYRFDISGLEGLNVPVVTVFLLLPLLLLWLALVLLLAILAFIRRRVITRPSAHRT